MPDLEEKFKFNDLRCGHKFVYDQFSPSMLPETGKYQINIEEILICSLGADVHRSSAFVILRNDKFDLYIYKVILSLEIPEECPKTRLGVQLVRIDHEHIGRDLQQYADSDGDKMQPIAESLQRQKHAKKMRLIPFEKIGVESQQIYSGVVVTGKRPCWIMMALSGGRSCANFIVQEGSEDLVLPPANLNSSNTLRVHPMIVDGQIDAFTALHNVNIPFGFAYINEKGLFRMAQLPIQFTYDNQLPICKVPLGRNANLISYHLPSQTYILGSSSRAVFQIDQARYMAAVAAGVIEAGDELPDSEKKVSGIQDVINDRGIVQLMF
jgi:cleavage and polyadenylation specificity factor subunit 1